MEKAQGGFILDPSTGEPAAIATIKFDTEDARVLRLYKKLLHKYQLREAVYCQNCWNHQLSDGLEAFVTDDAIVFRCRCTQRVFQGPTY